MEKSVEQRTMSKVAWRLLPLIVIIYCEDQAEVDHFWEKFSEGGEKRPCGWLKDKFGLSWQIVPDEMITLIKDSDPEKSRRVMEAMFQMTKIDIAKLRQAHRGE